MNEYLRRLNHVVIKKIKTTVAVTKRNRDINITNGSEYSIIGPLFTIQPHNSIVIIIITGR